MKTPIVQGVSQPGTAPGIIRSMIRYLEGSILSLSEDSLVVVVQGLGYKVATTTDTLRTLSLGDDVSLHTHLAVRETALDLYGFTNLQELSLFELLLGVSGVGPKSALSVLSAASREVLQRAIHEQNAQHLIKVGGIGKKTAEKIVLELKDKIHMVGENPGHITGNDDALEALKAMGYTLQEARDALKQVPSTISEGSERLREALKSLA